MTSVGPWSQGRVWTAPGLLSVLGKWCPLQSLDGSEGPGVGQNRALFAPVAKQTEVTIA